MRVIIKARTQRKLIEYAKKHTDLTWKKLASLLNVNEHTLRYEWRLQKNFIPYSAFNKLLKLSKLTSIKIIELRKENWGQQLGAMNSNKKRKYKIKAPSRDAKLAELIGIILGDGSIFSDDKNGIYYLRIFFNSLKELKYMKYVKSLMVDVFKTEPKLRKFKNQNCIYLVIQNKAIVEYLKTENLLPGNKIKNKLSIPQWIWSNSNLLRVCIRGLVDTDGSIYRLTPHWTNLIQIQFKNYNKKLLEDVQKALIKLGFNPSKIHTNRIVLTRQTEINKYMKEIGTINKNIAP